MSRRYDEYMEGSFELYGERYWLVEPDNLEELLKAFHVRDLIQEGWSGLLHDEDASVWETLLQEQEAYIQEFIENREDFNNGILVKNIAFLLKKYDLRMGDLEKVLGISAGYISRTAKENSAKKLSIDVVWKIAELFGISVDKLIGDDISELNGNIGMLVDFMEKLRHQTECVDIEWDNLGGVHEKTDEQFDQLGLFNRDTDGAILYAAPERNPKVKFYLADDVIGTYNVDEFRQMIIIPFHAEKDHTVHYDFMFVWSTRDSETDAREKIFYSYDEPFGTLDRYAEALYREAKEHFMDVPVSADMRKFISGYLGKAGDQK